MHHKVCCSCCTAMCTGRRLHTANTHIQHTERHQLSHINHKYQPGCANTPQASPSGLSTAATPPCTVEGSPPCTCLQPYQSVHPAQTQHPSAARSLQTHIMSAITVQMSNHRSQQHNSSFQQQQSLQLAAQHSSNVQTPPDCACCCLAQPAVLHACQSSNNKTTKSSTPADTPTLNRVDVNQRIKVRILVKHLNRQS